MAKESVKKFFDEVSKNEDLQKQLKAATEKNEAEIAKAVKAQAEAVASVAKGAGFDFTADEFLSVGAPEGSNLDMNELDAVAGGGGFCFFVGSGDGGKQGAAVCKGFGLGFGSF